METQTCKQSLLVRVNGDQHQFHYPIYNPCKEKSLQRSGGGSECRQESFRLHFVHVVGGAVMGGVRFLLLFDRLRSLLHHRVLVARSDRRTNDNLKAAVFILEVCAMPPPFLRNSRDVRVSTKPRTPSLRDVSFLEFRCFVASEWLVRTFTSCRPTISTR